MLMDQQKGPMRNVDGMQRIWMNYELNQVTGGGNTVNGIKPLCITCMDETRVELDFWVETFTERMKGRSKKRCTDDEVEDLKEL